MAELCSWDTLSIIKNVDTKFLCTKEVLQLYFDWLWNFRMNFAQFSHYIGKKITKLCDCGVKDDVFHYIFGKCLLLLNFTFISKRTNVKTEFLL